MSQPPWKLHGRSVTVESGDQPGGPRSVPLAGLVSTLVVVLGLGLVVVGVWNGAGWEWGLVALGVAMLAIERWPDQKGPT